MNQLTLSQGQVVRTLARLAVAFVVAYVAARFVGHAMGLGRLSGVLHLFDLDSEKTPPAIFSALILMTAALLLGLISVFKWKQADRDAIKWSSLGAGFMLMSADELASFHEMLNDPVSRLIGPGQTEFEHSAWALVGIVIVLVLVIYFWGFLSRLPAPTRQRFIIAGAIYLSGTIGFELLGGAYLSAHANVHDMYYYILVILEEGCEMTGVILFIRALLAYVAEHYADVQLRVT